MPYIEGETLRDKLDRETQLGIDEAVRITREVADAIDYAHRHGIIHRDIKPENILLHDGRPVVADFGIALAVSAAAGGRMTETGTSIGTPHYMSPEQATGDKQITGRADIYSLASVLYEMLAGNPPHVGSSAQQVIMKIIAEPVQPVTALRKSVPANVAAAVMMALEKLPADRFESAKAFADALANRAFTTVAMTSGPAGSGLPKSWRSWIRDPRSRAVLAATTLLAIAALTAWVFRPAGETHTGTLRFTIDGPDDPSILRLNNTAVSPDAQTISFSALTSRGPVLYIRRLDSFELFEVENACCAFFSTDSESMAFLRTTEVWTLDLDERVPTRVGSLPENSWDLSGLRWHPDGRILVTAARGLWTLRMGEVEPSLFVPVDSLEIERFGGVTVFPDGRIALHVENSEDAHIEIVSAGGDERSRILPGIPRALMVHGEDDILFFEQGGQNRATYFDARRLEPVGPSVVLTEWPDGMIGSSIGWLDGTGDHDLEMVRVSRDGTASPIGIERGVFRWPRMSPDGSRIVYGAEPPAVSYGIRSFVLRTGTTTSLEGDTEPVWSSDSFRVFTSLGGRPNAGLLVQVADGSLPADTLLSLSDGDSWPTSASPDGRWLAFYGTTLGSGEGDDATDPNDLHFMDLDSREIRRVRIPGTQRGARFSPDGRWVAFESTESGTNEVWVRPWPAMDARYRISTGGGFEPLWSSDSQTLFYRYRDQVMEVPKTARDGAIEQTPPRLLFTGNFDVNGAGDQSWDIGPDGQFLMMRPVQDKRIDIRVALNWIADVRARLERAK
jgi:serine/threonine-protein kinase